MLERAQLRKAVYRAIDQVNELLLDDVALSKEDTTILIGDGSKLDSMGFINFVVALEGELTKEVNLDLHTAEELMSAIIESPAWSTVGELVETLLSMVDSLES